MAEYINKESWYTEGYHSKKFHHRNITSKRYLGYNDRNLDFINDVENSLSEINKDLKESCYPLNLNRERFIKIPDDTDF